MARARNTPPLPPSTPSVRPPPRTNHPRAPTSAPAPSPPRHRLNPPASSTHGHRHARRQRQAPPPQQWHRRPACAQLFHLMRSMLAPTARRAFAAAVFTPGGGAVTCPGRSPGCPPLPRCTKPRRGAGIFPPPPPPAHPCPRPHLPLLRRPASAHRPGHHVRPHPSATHRLAPTPPHAPTLRRTHRRNRTPRATHPRPRPARGDPRPPAPRRRRPGSATLHHHHRPATPRNLTTRRRTTPATHKQRPTAERAATAPDEPTHAPLHITTSTQLTPPSPA